MHVDQLKEPGYLDAPCGGKVPLTTIPALDLTRELYAAVIRSVDDDVGASEALEKLQHRVLLACARFEAATVIV